MIKLDVFDYVLYSKIFSGFGISFMSGSMIFLLMGEKNPMAKWIFFLGFLFLCLGVWCRIKEEKFKEDKHWGILERDKKK